ncbi:protein NETWORKED 4A-like isoform X2 [Juglans microcarpa x Juglans regia]|uniref:protein NETWORKED 4A-like isoform X2 n=2 Tax=Juglans microcarpa x Juglans regia TaxID=2249226 RepID=UPI001B7E6023|nr:protein NETWORKED 4A-like isoform X2 [Juglans microcarpa x Juglans regia]
MASSMVHSSKHMKRTESRKPHSWWWDSHISLKNSKWLAENLEEMDQSVKQMMKLIEDDGDSFAKKAEMYYKKRPELISHVEDFYRMYRSLAERYDHVTGELRKNIPSDLQSQGSGISDAGLELLSTPDNRLGRRRSSHRAAGFDFFLGSGGNSSDVYQKEGDESSTLTDSEPESDDSSVNNYPFLLGNGGDPGLSRKIVELEIELREMKEKFRMQQEGNADGSFREAKNEIPEDFPSRIAHYEQELRIANGKISQSEEEIARLKIEIQKCKSLEFGNDFQSGHGSSAQEEVKMQEAELEADLALGIQQRVGQAENGKIKALVEELRINKEKLRESEKEIARLKHDLESNKSSENTRHLQDQIELAHKEIVTWKTKLNVEKRQVSKLQERILRLKASLSDRDHEVRDLKIAVSDAEQKIFPEKSNLKAEMSKMLEECTRLEEELREWESRARLLEDEIRKVKAEKTEIEIRLTGEIEQLKAEIVDRGDRIEILNKSLDGLKLERDELNAKALTLTAEMSSRDDQINQMDKRLQQYHKEHAELIAGIEGTNKLAEELRSRAEELEAEVERQRVVISEGAEEKREAIRQLCFSLEHYRNGYHMLRQAFIGQKRVSVLAS